MKKHGSGLGSNKSFTRNVSFNEAPKTILVEPDSDNQNASWYSPDEIKDFRKKEVDSPLSGSSLRKDFVRSLLNVQKEHKDMGIHDPKGLRQMSRASSRESMKKAIERAQHIVSDGSNPARTTTSTPLFSPPRTPRRMLKTTSRPERKSLHDPLNL